MKQKLQQFIEITEKFKQKYPKIIDFLHKFETKLEAITPRFDDMLKQNATQKQQQRFIGFSDNESESESEHDESKSDDDDLNFTASIIFKQCF